MAYEETGGEEEEAITKMASGILGRKLVMTP
jgi:hypothetical protein